MVSQSIRIKKCIYYITLVVVLSLMFIGCSQELCEMWQVPKDRWCILAVDLSLVAIFIVRKIPLRKIEVWGTLFAGVMFILFWFHYKEINVANYGDIYFQVLLYTWVAWMLLAVLSVDLLRSFGIRAFLRENWWKLALYIVFVIITVTTDIAFLVPVLCPGFALITTKKSKDEWIEICDCIGIAYYISYIFMMTKSLIVAPDAFESGRYMGVFLSVENMGAFCGLACVCVLYFMIRVLHTASRKWLGILIVVLMAVYPIYGILVNASRTTQMALVLTLLVAFIFMHGKSGAKVTIKRLLFAVATIAIMTVGLLALARIFDRELKSGKEYSPREKYIIAHIAKLADEEHDSTYFEKGTVVNALDGFTSGRFRVWAESIKQIEMKGHPYEIKPPINSASPHNFFIQKLIEMGWIKGILFNLFIVVAVVFGVRDCLKRNDEAIFPTLWLLYSVPVLASTIISWNSLLSYGMILFSSMLMINTHLKNEK